MPDASLLGWVLVGWGLWLVTQNIAWGDKSQLVYIAKSFGASILIGIVLAFGSAPVLGLFGVSVDYAPLAAIGLGYAAQDVVMGFANRLAKAKPAIPSTPPSQ